MTAPQPLVDAHTHLLIRAPAPYPPPMHAIEHLLELQRSHGITQSVIYSPMEILRAFAANEEPLVMCRRYNDFIAGIQEAHPGEVLGVGLVYPFEGDASAREAERAVRDLGLHGVMVNPYLRGAWLDQDERAEPLLGAMEQMAAPLIVHPEDELEQLVAKTIGRELRHAEGLILWRTLATTFALYGFTTGPLLRKFPSLRIVFAHGGGSFWSAAARIDVLFKELVPKQDRIIKLLWDGDFATDGLAWLRAHQVYVDTAWFDSANLRTAADCLGTDRLLYGTDGSAHPGSIQFFDNQLEQLGFSAEELQRIRHTNAVQLFGAA